MSVSAMPRFFPLAVLCLMHLATSSRIILKAADVLTEEEAHPLTEVSKPEVLKPKEAGEVLMADEAHPSPEVQKPEVPKPEVLKPKEAGEVLTADEAHPSPEVQKPPVPKPEALNQKPEVQKPKEAGEVLTADEAHPSPEVQKPPVPKPEALNQKPEVQKPKEAKPPPLAEVLPPKVLHKLLEADPKFKCTMKNHSHEDCGMTLTKDPTQTCFFFQCGESSPYKTCNNCWDLKTCETEDQCPFQMRLYITGQINLFSLAHVSASIAYDTHEIDGNPIVTDWLDMYGSWVQSQLVGYAVGYGNDFFQRELPNLRPLLMETVRDMLNNPYYWNQISITTKLAIGNDIDKFVTMVNDTTVRTTIDNETGLVNVTVSIPGMTTHSSLAACETLGGAGAYWIRVAISAAIGAMIAWKYPRVGLAVAIMLIVLSTTAILEPACKAFIPSLTKDSGVMMAKELELDEDFQEIGLPAILKYDMRWWEDDCHIFLTKFTTRNYSNMLNNLAAKYGKGILVPEENGTKLDLSVTGINVELASDRHIIQFTQGTYFDALTWLDADCIKMTIGTPFCLAREHGIELPR